MKRILIVLIVIAGGATGVLWYLNSHKKPVTPAPSQTNTNPITSTTPAAPSLKPFHSGVTIRPYGLKAGSVTYTKTQLETQITLAKDLGVTDVRANAENETATNDDFVSLAEENKLIPTLILEPIQPGYLDSDTYNAAYKYAKAIASRYKGRVPYYQLLNEASGVAIKPGAPGNKTSDYDAIKYTKLINSLKGLSDGVKAGDAAAQRIVTANWLGVGIIDKIMADKVDPDIFGWDWYSDMGTDLIKKLDDGTTLDIPSYLAHYNKQFWVVELNRREGSFDGNEKAQADFLQTFMTNVGKRPEVSGVFVYMLTDECGQLDKEFGHLGLVNLTKDSGGLCSVKSKKTAFATYKTALSNR